MSVFVIDASVAAKWFLPEDYAEAAESLLTDENTLHAPEFLLVEMDSILCKRIRRGALTRAVAEVIRQSLSDYPIRLEPMRDLRHAAFQVANQARCALYDGLYLTLAIQLNSQMVTADRRFFESVAAGPFGRHVRWIGDLREAG